MEENSNETEISNFPDKKFKETVIWMLNKLDNRIEKPREHFKKS